MATMCDSVDNIDPSIELDQAELLPYLHSQDLGSYYFNEIPALPNVDLAHLNKPPVLDELEDKTYNFEVQISSVMAGKSSYIYSSALKKLFVKISQTFSVMISYKNGFFPDPSRLNLRIMPVFTEPDDQHESVKRCRHHTQEINGATNFHILTCKNQYTEYYGTAEKTNYGERLSVTVPFNSSNEYINEVVNLEFHCQNSCASGINRRNTALIFILETEEKQIVGKRLLYFKVCSCPKRDCQKEEDSLYHNNHSNKRKREDGQAGPSGKRPCKILIKQELPSPEAYVNSVEHKVNPNEVTVSLKMPDVNSMLQVLRLAANELSGQADDSCDDEKRKLLHEYRKEILDLKDKVEKRSHSQ